MKKHASISAIKKDIWSFWVLFFKKIVQGPVVIKILKLRAGLTLEKEGERLHTTFACTDKLAIKEAEGQDIFEDHS